MDESSTCLAFKTFTVVVDSPALPGVLYLTASTFSPWLLIPPFVLPVAVCWYKSLWSVWWTKWGEFVSLDNNPGNSRMAAQMVVSGLPERTVYGGAMANYSSYFGTGAGLTCRNRIWVFLGCIFKLKVVQTFATHENGTRCLNLWVWSLILTSYKETVGFLVIKHDLCGNSHVAFCCFSLFKPRKLNGREDSASPHIAFWALAVFSKLSRTWTMQLLLQHTFFF